MCGQDEQFPFCKEHETLHDWVTDTIHDYLKTGKMTDEECCKDPECPIGRSVRFNFKDTFQVIIMRVNDEKIYVQTRIIATSKNQKKIARKIQAAIIIYISHYTTIKRTSSENYKRLVQKEINDGKLGLCYSMAIENPIRYDPEESDDASESEDESDDESDSPPAYEDDAPPAYS